VGHTTNSTMGRGGSNQRPPNIRSALGKYRLQDQELKGTSASTNRLKEKKGSTYRRGDHKPSRANTGTSFLCRLRDT